MDDQNQVSKDDVINFLRGRGLLGDEQTVFEITFNDKEKTSFYLVDLILDFHLFAKE